MTTSESAPEHVHPGPGVRARNRVALQEQLRDVGRAHLARDGAAALSLRAVARDMGRSPSALYRYVTDRDDLLTLLIIDAYDDLGDAVEQAAAQHRTSTRTQFEAWARALRTWALANPSEYALLYGSPVPGYHAPADRTRPAGNRPIAVLARIVAATRAVPPLAGTRATRQRSAATALRTAAQHADAAEFELTPEVLARAITVWNLILGSITSEVFEQLGPLTDSPEAVYAGAVDVGAALLFGDPPQRER